MMRIAAVVAFALASFGLVQAAGPDYPTKPIRLIVPFPPGGSADPLARAFAAWFAEKFGVSVVADNRPGAGTAIAHTLAAKAAPDGYTLLLGASSGMTTNPAMGAKLDYDSVKDFSPIGLVAYVPQLLVIHPSVPAKTMAEFIDVARRQPGKLSCGSPGVGSVGHLSVELINALAGIKLVHVPYKGAGPAMTDLVANRIQGLVGSVTGTYPQVAAGRLRTVGTGHAKRLKSHPDIPTIGETLPGFTNDGWYGLVAPAGTPSAIVEKLNQEAMRALANAEFARHIETIGMVPAGGSPGELHDWIRSEVARWGKVVREAGIGLNKP